MDQVDIIRLLIQGEEGRQWADERKKGWSIKSNDTVCEWEGITCDSDGDAVTSIILAETDLLATIPSELALLSSLIAIDLRQNLIRGTIPPEFASMPNLQSVIFKENHLTGQLPSFVAKNLTLLDLSSNRLSGEIVSDFGLNNVGMTFLDLQRNQFTGFLPFGLEDLHELRTVSLSFNQLWGTLPEYLGSMSKLAFLYLDHNHLVGTLPADLGSNAPAVLQEVWLQNNQLSGSIPSSLAETTSLRDLYLDGNKLTGSVPAKLCKEQLNADFFVNLPPDTDRGDFCDSVSCPAGTVSDDGVFPCRACASTVPSPYLGRKGECDNFSEAGIVDLILGHGGMNSTLDSACDYDGVKCNSDGKVVSIMARHLGLRGTLPDELGYLPFLSQLDVSDNFLTGYFPSGLRLAPLTSLHIGGNMLKGIIPPLMCENADKINGGQDGDCTSIVCPMGSYSDGKGFGDCLLCPDGAPYLGSKYCSPLNGDSSPSLAPKTSHNTAPTIVPAVILAVSIMGACVGAYFLYRISRGPRKQRDTWGYDYGVDDEKGSASLPHSEEVKTMLRKFRNRGEKNGNQSGTKWLQNRLKRSYHYAISLAETEAVIDAPGVAPTDVTGGEIDDFGWQERESILNHRDLENAVEAQKNKSKLEVWEYPDPLEKQILYTGSNDEQNSIFGSDDENSDDDLSEWIRKQQSDPETREVWLDVPHIE